MRMMKKLSVLLLIFCIYLSSSIQAFAADQAEISQVVTNTASYLTKTVSEPQVGSIGGEWAVIGLARSGYSVPQSYYDDYYKVVEKYVKELGGVLHDKKYTEYSRVILALSAIGKDPSNVAGYNLLEPLGDFDKTNWQGINGPIFALIALDSGRYEIPVNKNAKTQATREMYIDEILTRQLADGGFALSGNTADPDVTGMALQALAKYQSREKVKAATDKAVEALSNMQNNSGGYATWGTENVESAAQVLMALCELGIRPDDRRFTKNGHNLVENLLSYYREGQGFMHTADGSGENLMSTEQAFYTLVNVQRVGAGKTSLYNMADVKKGSQTNPGNETKTPETEGLPNKNKDVKPSVITNAGRTFTDIQGHVNQKSIEAMAARNILNGISDTQFAPDRTMTRAEFAAIVTRSLGLTPKAAFVFKDVTADSWYAPYVGTAYTYDLIQGTSEDTFTPEQTITRQEAAVMVARAAKLCGLDTNVQDIEIRDMLAQFTDYTKTAEWARASLALSYREHILSQDMIEIQPEAAVTRSEVSDMLYQLLMISKLL
ncbi:S-layer homology domain-containing protein [Paenibacillus chondroitinus]|uniref:S-layer homology domain-containing protein n=1 Tax=Paenibacillus chondroitinus TaxID=59842 RepID=A0ABU6D886_9BACL|nr:MULTISPECIES: S-layer homology domain-containing protein [Paenibacillus]MCY9661878.1 S-layer homology domain-containing protein [Paenibacillus anseongense]MEB4793964.1 S-layer homology domain-containing protein [Paenibacillus chondroitinus]